MSSEDDFLAGEKEESEDDDDVVELAVADSSDGIVRPAEDIKNVVELYDQFEEIKEELLDHSTDIAKISGEPHVKKSGWRKIATAFNVSTELVDSGKEIENGVIKYQAVVRAEAPNGKTATATGMAGSNESNFMRSRGRKGEMSDQRIKKLEKKDDVLLIDGAYRGLKDPREVNDHNVMALAETRAKNRAISDLVGGGEVSAEEMTADMVLS